MNIVEGFASFEDEMRDFSTTWSIIPYLTDNQNSIYAIRMENWPKIFSLMYLGQGLRKFY